MPRRATLVLANVFVVAACALVYELTTAALASYVLGDAIAQFSLVLGIYLAAMGAGAWLTRRVKNRVVTTFLAIEVVLAAVGGMSSPILFRLAEHATIVTCTLYANVFAIGLLVGFELPLLMRVLVDEPALVERSLAWDNAGALVASLVFPIFLVPVAGLMRASLLTGLVNAAVAASGTWLLRADLTPRAARSLRVATFAVACGLTIALVHAPAWTEKWAQ